MFKFINNLLSKGDANDKNKPQINPDHPRIKNRTPEMQKYRDDLANTLKLSKKLWKVGKMVIVEGLKKAYKNVDFVLDKYWCTKKWAQKLLAVGLGWVIIKNIDQFTWLDQEIALSLIKAGLWLDVINNLKKFEWLDHKEMVLELIKIGLWLEVINNLEKFEGLDHKETALALVKAGLWFVVIKNRKKFTLSNKDLKDITQEVFKGWMTTVGKTLEKIKWLNREKITQAFIEKILMPKKSKKPE